MTRHQVGDMASRSRLRRAQPERTGPIRNVTTYFRDSDSWDAGSAQPETAGREGESATEPLDDAVTHGVKLGYQVIDEHIQQGRRVAQKCREGSYGAEDLGGDVGEFIARALRIYQDFGTLCFEVMEAVARNPVLLSALNRSARKKGPAPAGEPGVGPEAGGSGLIVGVDVDTRRSAKAWADVQPATKHFTPLVRALHAADPKIPPLTGTRFIPHPSGRGVMLRVEVPTEQPAATYSGVVVDSETNEPRGTVCVTILD